MRIRQIRETLDEQDIELLGGPLAQYCRALLKVKPKEGPLEPFVLNRAQMYVDSILDEQLARTGRVRALVLKGRQQGVSTYIGARYFRRMHALPGTNAFLLSHEETSTNAIGDMLRRYLANLPPEYRPHVANSNSKEMFFNLMGSRYRFATAGAKETGRSQTNQLFHGSEVAHWPNDEAHFAASVQAIPYSPNSEIILETTANGISGKFYEMWIAAEKGEGLYIPIFVPWWWQEEYEIAPPAEWRPVEEELKYADNNNLSRGQAYWLHLKNIELGGKVGKIGWRFKQEYPSNPREAFQSGGDAGLIDPEDITRCRNQTFEDPDPAEVAHVVGLDVARNVRRGDRTKFLGRRGRIVGREVDLTMMTDDTMEIVGKAVRLFAEQDIDHMFIDMGGPGAGVYDRLCELGYRPRVTGVMFAEAANDDEKYKNRRAEMWWRMKEAIEDKYGLDLPDSDVLHRHIAAPMEKPNSMDRRQLESKDDIRKRLKFSPDEGDALALTFHTPVVKEKVTNIRRRRQKPRNFMAS